MKTIVYANNNSWMQWTFLACIFCFHNEGFGEFAPSSCHEVCVHINKQFWWT